VRSPFEESVHAAVCTGVDTLLLQQDRDGFWREFDLQPGASEGWTTAWVGWCLNRAAVDPARRARIRDAYARAARRLCQSTGGGWGYNGRTGPDADTTSWVLRFLNASGVRVDPVAHLARYIDAGGGVHTFREPGFGAWTDAHDDVAANAGLALLTVPRSRPITDRIRRRLVGGFPGETYWWSTPTYGIAWTLRFLQASGGVPVDVAARGGAWLSDLPASDSAFEIAHRIVSAAALGACPGAAFSLVNQLLDAAGPQGWAGGSFLLVPPHEGGAPAAPNPERRALLTTSICVAVLSEWLAGAAIAASA
jgi:hypothetical protein